MPQGSFKKTSHPGKIVKKSSPAAAKNKNANKSRKAQPQQSKGQLKNMIKKNLESNVRKAVESDLCQQAKSVEAKSFKMLKPWLAAIL